MSEQMIQFPTSSDIYLEANGKKIAVVQNYRSVSKRTEKTIEAFGEAEPVATIASQKAYQLELTRLYATDEAIRDGLNFYDLSGFSLVICKPDRKIIYSDCQWSNISENASLGDMVIEKITVVAAKRIETDA